MQAAVGMGSAWCWQALVQCREPQTGQPKVRLSSKGETLCPSGYDKFCETVEATLKGYFTPASRDPDHVQRIRNGDSSTKAKILYADGRVFVIACALFIK